MVNPNSSAFTFSEKIGVVTAAELVCNKAFKQRFAEVLMGACMNLAGC